MDEAHREKQARDADAALAYVRALRAEEECRARGSALISA